MTWRSRPFPRKIFVRLGDWLLGDGDARFCRQPRNDLVTHVFDTLRVEKDFYRYALDNLDKIPGGVIGRQQSEIGSGPWLKAIDASGEFMVRQGIDFDLYGLANLHALELGLLNIGENPHVVLDNGHQRLSDR